MSLMFIGTILQCALPSLWEFVLLLATVFITIFITPVIQRFLLRMESFMMYPFICPKCVNFWANLIMNIFYAYLINPYFLLWGTITSVILAIMYIYTYRQFNNN